MIGGRKLEFSKTKFPLAAIWNFAHSASNSHTTKFPYGVIPFLGE
jgi:hypothetical protein